MIILLSIISLIPCLIALYGKNSFITSRDSALHIYQSQLKELEQELDNHLILPETYQQAKLEIQRRILKNDTPLLESSPPSSAILSNSGLWSICCGLICIPLAAIGLYLMNGMPALPPQPLQARLIIQQEQNQKLAPYLQQLKDRIQTLSPEDPKWFEGYVLLGKIEADQGHYPEAIQAWKQALHQHYDPTLAAQTAETMTQKDGHVSQEAYDLFNQALKSAPTDAPWKELAEQRIIEYQKNHP